MDQSLNHPSTHQPIHLTTHLPYPTNTESSTSSGQQEYQSAFYTPYGIAERIASFLSVKDIIVYFSLDEKAKVCYETYASVRDLLDHLLGSLSLLRLLEWGLCTAGRVINGSALLVVSCVKTVGRGIHSIYSQIMATLSYFVRLGLALWNELRQLSLRELIRALLLLLTEKLEGDMSGRVSLPTTHPPTHPPTQPLLTAPHPNRLLPTHPPTHSNRKVASTPVLPPTKAPPPACSNYPPSSTPPSRTGWMTRLTATMRMEEEIRLLLFPVGLFVLSPSVFPPTHLLTWSLTYHLPTHLSRQEKLSLLTHSTHPPTHPYRHHPPAERRARPGRF